MLMPSTNLVYLSDFKLLQAPAQLIDLLEENGRTVLILDQTIFYPQGGGQPYDQGTIENEGGIFKVEEVRFFDGIVNIVANVPQGS